MVGAKCAGHPPGEICDHVRSGSGECPVCGGTTWRWTDSHGVATCRRCATESALLASAADLTKGSSLPQSLLKAEWFPRYKQWWSSTQGNEGFKDWWERTNPDPNAVLERERRKTVFLESKQKAELTLDDLMTALYPLKGDTFHCNPAVTCHRSGGGDWTVHIQPGMSFMGPEGHVSLPWFKGPNLQPLLDDLIRWLNEHVASITMPSGYNMGGTYTLEALIVRGDMGIGF